MAKPTDPKTGDGAASPRAKRRGGGRTLHKDAKKKRFLTELAGGASVGKAAAAVGIGRRTAYDWRSGDEAFAAAWDEAYETGTDLMEDEAKRRGIDGVDEPIYYKGEQCGTVRKYSDLLLMAQLNARRPEKYRQRTSTELTGKNGAPYSRMSMSHSPTAIPVTIDLRLHAKQKAALLTSATELLYGGAAGGGKSHLMRAAAIIWCADIPGLQVYLFRRKLPDLIKNHIEGPKGFRALLAPWIEAGFVEMVEGEIRFWNGAKIYLCHCKDEKDRFNYHGAEIHVLLIDELTHFSAIIYKFLRSRVRMVGINLPAKYKGMFPRILAGSNPGNVGHLWVKADWIDNALAMDLRPMSDNEGGMLRQYIPAKLVDNPSMAVDDPTYRARLRGLGSESLVRAMEDGDWSIIDGAYFDCWRTEKHVVRPFAIPAYWMRLCSFDWGSARPFSVGWWAIAGEDFQHPDGPRIPKGAMVRYREWYGAKAPNVGLKLDAEEVARGIVAREEDGEKIDRRIADPSIAKHDGGPSIRERMYEATEYRVRFELADNQRLAGWDQLRGRFIGDGDGRPMIYCFSTCLDSIRTIPAAQHDQMKIEELDTDGEDHCLDDWRYAAMARPWTRPKPEPEETEIKIPALNIQIMKEAQKLTRDERI